MNRKLDPLRMKNDVTQAIQLKLHEQMKKQAQISRHMVITKLNTAVQVLTKKASPRTGDVWIGKTIYKNTNIKKKIKIDVNMPLVKNH